MQIGSSESDLRALGLRNFRVRFHGETARIELGQDEFAKLLDPVVRERAHQALQKRVEQRISPVGAAPGRPKSAPL